MKKTAKLMALLLALVMALSLVACSNNGPFADPDSGSSDPAESKTAESNQPSQAPAESSDPASGEKYVVGICQLLPHTALNAATEGFKDALKEEFGDNVEIKEGNAGGDPANCTTIIDGYVADGVNLILANATPSLTAAASATDTIPILGTAVTNYGIALNLDTTEDKVLGGNISGTSDLAPLDQQAAMIQELFPEATNVGLLYCTAEPNSVYQIETIQGFLESMGYTCTRYGFNDVNDLAAVTQTAADNSDVIYIPTDNTAADNTSTIADVVIPAKVPVICGEEGICGGCGVATLSISYYEIGHIAGEMAAQILKGEKSVSEMPIGFDTTLDKKYNASICEQLGLTMPADYVAIEG